MKKVLLYSAIVGSIICSEADTLSLNSGWNLVGTNSILTLNEIKSNLGSDNVLVIQGPTKGYKKEYLGTDFEVFNTFSSFDKGKGYWVKLQSSATLNYTPAVITGNETQALSIGWNLIAPLYLDTLSSYKNKAGDENLLVIQGPTKGYKKEYVGTDFEVFNTFTSYEAGKGYWVKINSLVQDLYTKNFVGNDLDLSTIDSEVDDLLNKSILLMSNSASSYKTELMTFDSSGNYKIVTVPNFSASTLNGSDSDINSTVTTAISSVTTGTCGNYNLKSTDIINITPESTSTLVEAIYASDGNLTIGNEGYRKVVWYYDAISLDSISCTTSSGDIFPPMLPSTN
jgi:hypothetical protein